MNTWLEFANLDSSFRLLHSSDVADYEDSLEDWVAFLFWLGWWARMNAKSEVRLFLFVLLPTRICCSAIAAFGSHLASSSHHSRSMSFSDFIDLPDDATVSLRVSNSIVAGTIGPRVQQFGNFGRWVDLHSHEQKFQESRLFVAESNLANLGISTEPRKEISKRRQNKLSLADSIYRTVSARTRSDWCTSVGKDTVLVTSKAPWYRELDGLEVQVATSNQTLRVPFLDLLVVSEKLSEFPGKLLLVSPASNIAERVARVAVLDGPESVQTAGTLPSDVTVSFVEHCEYDENVLAKIRSLATARDLEATPSDFPKKIPKGVDVSMFGWYNQ